MPACRTLVRFRIVSVSSLDSVICAQCPPVALRRGLKGGEEVETNWCRRDLTGIAALAIVRVLIVCVQNSPVADRGGAVQAATGRHAARSAGSAAQVHPGVVVAMQGLRVDRRERRGG
jgi:hypothetical protein